MSEADEINEMMVDIVADTWNTYLGAAVEPRGPIGGPVAATSAEDTAAAATDTDEDGVEARIEISGHPQWELMLRGTWASAEEATRRMLGSGDRAGELLGAGVDATDCVSDAWGELANTLAGNLKAALGPGTHRLSTPQVGRARAGAGSPTAGEEKQELLFEWDGYLAIVRVVQITPS